MMSHDDDDDGNDDGQGSIGIKVTEASTEENVDDYLHDDANKEPENVESEGELDDTKNLEENNDHVSWLILRLEHNVEEGEIMHTYTLDEIIKMTHVEDIDFKFDFEEELNQFNINQQPDYQYKYVKILIITTELKLRIGVMKTNLKVFTLKLLTFLRLLNSLVKKMMMS
ncbi:hypothetical protein Hanom_Chr10g00910041 [Helianthus anomalus]